MVVILFSALCAKGQGAYEWQTKTECMDNDFRELRNNIDPNFRHHYDDVLQYVPGGTMLILKTCTYESRSNWGRMLSSDAMSILLMTSVVNSIKYTARRVRPDGYDTKSYPSGHTATAFMTATMLHKEYGWRSHWWSIGGYSLALATAASRNLNDKHWLTDILTGALIGIGTTELGYFITDCIFKDRGLGNRFRQHLHHDCADGCNLYHHYHYSSTDHGYYSLGPIYSRRFILGNNDLKADGTFPYRGSSMSINAEFPLLAGSGISCRATASSLLFRNGNSFNAYSGQVGMFWEREFRKWIELETQALIGYAKHKAGGGIDINAGASLNIITGSHCKLKGIAEWETFSWAGKTSQNNDPNFLNSILLGFSAAFYW